MQRLVRERDAPAFGPGQTPAAGIRRAVGSEATALGPFATRGPPPLAPATIALPAAVCRGAAAPAFG